MIKFSTRKRNDKTKSIMLVPTKDSATGDE